MFGVAQWRFTVTNVQCVRCGREAEGLDAPPTGGKLGQDIQARVCVDCWNEWQSQQVLYINHYGLMLADPDDRKKLIQAMKEFLAMES